MKRGLLVWLSLVSCTAPAWPLVSAAQPAAPDAARVIELRVVGSPASREALRSALPRAIRGTPVVFSAAPALQLDDVLQPSGAPPGSLRSIIDLTEPRRAHLYFADAEARRFLVRELELPRGLDHVAREAIVQVLELSVEALLDAAQPALDRQTAERLITARAKPAEPLPCPVCAASPPAAPTWLPAAGAFYSIRTTRWSESVAHGPGVGLAWTTAHAPFTSALWLTGRYEWQQSRASDWAAMRFSTTALRASWRTSWQLDPAPLELGLSLGAGVDLTAVSPRAVASDAEVELRPESLAAAPVLSPALIGAWRVSPALRLSVELFADVFPTRTTYDVRREDERRVVYRPDRIRPGLLAGVLID